MSIEEFLDSAAQLDTPELEHLASEVHAMLAKRRAFHQLTRRPGDEAALLQKINQSLPPDVQQRYDELMAKLSEETLTSNEHQELLALIDRIEEADAERVQALAALAHLRNVSITALMEELGIHSPSNA